MTPSHAKTAIVILTVLGACGSPPPVSRRAAIAPATTASTPPEAAPTPLAAPVLVHLAAGSAHACALLPRGTVRCWGDNVVGQLGDASMETRTRAVPAIAPENVVSLAAGDDFTCALDAGDRVTCWGAETAAHFGESITRAESEATVAELCARGDKASCANVAFRKRIPDIVKKAAAEAARQLALHPEQRAELERRAASRGAAAASPRPPRGAPLPSLAGIGEISASGTQACARSRSGSVWCFTIAAPSSPHYSYVSDGPRHWKPVVVPGLDDALHVATGSFQACAVRRSGQVVCWEGTDAPAPVPGIDDATAIAAGVWHACALRRSGQVACWGRGDRGQVGGQSTNTATVVSVDGITDALSVAAGGELTCVRHATGAVSCWGELADLGGEGAWRPRRVEGVDGALEVAVGEGFACAAMPNATVRCWGASSRGRLGRGVMPETLSPRLIEGLDGVVDVNAFTKGSCALRGDGTVVCWGEGARDPERPFAPIPGLSDVVAIGARDHVACAVERSGTASCWGPGGPTTTLDGVSDVVAVAPSVAVICAVRRTGQVGCGWTGRPLQTVAGVSGAVDVRIGDSDWACARRAGGTIACWDTKIELSDSPPKFRIVPVPALGDVVDLETRGLQTCAVRKTGRLECFGSGLSPHGPEVAIPQTRVIDATAISMSESDVWSCILRRGGAVACRDNENRWGEMGDGPLGFRGPYYVDIPTPTDAARVDVGYDHACALKKDGTVWCWGNDDVGQVSGRGVARFQPAAEVIGLDD